MSPFSGSPAASLQAAELRKVHLLWFQNPGKLSCRKNPSTWFQSDPEPALTVVVREALK